MTTITQAATEASLSENLLVCRRFREVSVLKFLNLSWGLLCVREIIG